MGKFSRWRLVGLATVLGLVAVPVAPLGADVQGGPVVGSVQQVFTPGSPTSPSAPVSGYEGEPLTLQAVNVGDTAMEPTLGVTSDGTAFFAASSLVVDTAITWGVAKTNTMRSQDGGLTWESVQLRAPVVEDSIPPGNADPVVWVDRTTDRIFNIDLYAGCSNLNYSDDLGDSWTTIPAACGDFVNDHHTIVAGPPPAGTTTLGYPNVLYYCFNRVIDANCGRSIDGGTTWTPTLGASFLGYDPAAGGLCGGLHGHVRTDLDGRLFVPKGHCGKPWVAISEDAGDTWTRVKVSDVATAGTHLSIDSDTDGNLYLVWWGGREGDDRLPFMAISRDHGLTWGEPMMIAPPDVDAVNFPVLTAGDAGHVAVSFPSSGEWDGDQARRPWDQTVVLTTNALDDEPVFLSATANDPADPIHRGPCDARCGGLWDFLDITVGPTGELWAAASDDCVGPCVDRNGATTHAGEGIAIRQIGGPLLATPAASLPLVDLTRVS